jgi:hypothetical protein
VITLTHRERRKARLIATSAQFDKLHEALAKVRSTSKTVTVEKSALDALLRDYASLLEILNLEP